MSRRPGIGRDWYEKYGEEAYQFDMIHQRNLTMRPPKYYDSLYNEVAPLDMEELKKRRQQWAAKRDADNIPSRLSIKHQLAQIRANKLKRSFES